MPLPCWAAVQPDSSNVEFVVLGRQGGFRAVEVLAAAQAWLVVPVLAVYGRFSACTDGVGRAWISTLLPVGAQGTGQGLYQASRACSSRHPGP
jgi:hypothetical protein